MNHADEAVRKLILLRSRPGRHLRRPRGERAASSALGVRRGRRNRADGLFGLVERVTSGSICWAGGQVLGPGSRRWRSREPVVRGRRRGCSLKRLGEIAPCWGRGSDRRCGRAGRALSSSRSGSRPDRRRRAGKGWADDERLCTRARCGRRSPAMCRWSSAVEVDAARRSICTQCEAAPGACSSPRSAADAAIGSRRAQSVPSPWAEMSRSWSSGTSLRWWSASSSASGRGASRRVFRPLAGLAVTPRPARPGAHAAIRADPARGVAGTLSPDRRRR